MQGLGTSTSKEGKEYFRELIRHKKDFKWESEMDGDAIEMAFSKKKSKLGRHGCATMRYSLGVFKLVHILLVFVLTASIFQVDKLLLLLLVTI
jgi:hypothetical protein